MKRSFTTAAATILTLASVMGIGGCQTVQEPDTSGKQQRLDRLQLRL
ncbi:MAG: hypothetical protein GVY04_00085 [Cyanobacteria bacterium]|nr:hypothetical protein [Cyanobacteria bacterium GSL.Bin1]